MGMINDTNFKSYGRTLEEEFENEVETPVTKEEEKENSKAEEK